MNNSQITALLRSCPETRRHFRGVYASDTLPTQSRSMSTPRSYICNLDSIDEPGSHWIAFYVPKRGPIEYFDSLGLDIPWMFRDFVRNRYYVYNTCTIQTPFSAVCGQHCIYYLFQRGLCNSMDEALSIFRDYDPLYNDILVNQIVEEHFKVRLNLFDFTL